MTSKHKEEMPSIKANDMSLGEVLTAIYIRLITNKTYLPSHLVVIEGKLHKLYGTKVLNKKLNLATMKNIIKIEVIEDRISKNGRPYKNFHVDFLSEEGYSVDLMLDVITWEHVVAMYSDLYTFQRIDESWKVDCVVCPAPYKTMYLYNENQKRTFYCHACKVTGDLLNWLDLVEKKGYKTLCSIYKNKRLLVKKKRK